jgi:hypothetical protein
VLVFVIGHSAVEAARKYTKDSCYHYYASYLEFHNIFLKFFPVISLGGMNWIVRFRVGQSGGLWCEDDEFIDRLEQLLTSRQELCCLTLIAAMMLPHIVTQ